MTNEITIEKTDWAGKEVWIICSGGKQLTSKMYQSQEAAQQEASPANAHVAEPFRSIINRFSGAR